MPTKAELLETLEAERWRTLGMSLDRTESRLSRLETSQISAQGELGEIRKELGEIKATLIRQEQRQESSGIARILQMLEKGGWRERLSLLSVPLAMLFFGYCLAASAPPDQVLSGLLQTARICLAGAPPASASPSIPPQETPDDQ